VDPILLPSALALLAASLLGASLPLTRRWSDRGLHLFVALSAGVFLGTIFFHLLPHLAGIGDHAGHAHGPEDVHDALSPVWPWAAALLGLLLLFALEKVWLSQHTAGHGANPHAVLWSATFLGLTLHAVTTGFALSGVLEHPDTRAQFLLSVLVHKGTECFSLATVMRLAGLPTRKAVLLLGLFALIEPSSLLLGGGLLSVHPAVSPILTGFASGTFLYVAVCDLLPEVFHGAGRPRTKLVAVLFGTALTAVTLPRLEALGAWVLAVARESWSVFVAMAPFLLLGSLLAGLVHAWVNTEGLVRRLRGDNLRSVAWAALLGAPLPLCSCSVVPMAVALRRQGASKGATAAFSVATPETGVDSIAVTWALLDPLLTIARPVGAVISAIASGLCVNWVVRRGLDREPAHAPPPAAAPGADPACGCAHEDADPGVSACVPAATASGARSGSKLARALRFATVELFDDLSGSLIAGILLSGALSALIPDGWFTGTAAQGFGGLLLALLVGIPLYVCASASTPIAAAMILKGLSPGAAFVFLLAGPATNAASLLVLARHLGRRVVLAQLAALSAVTVLLGWLVDRLYGWLALAPSARLAGGEGHLLSWIGTACAVALAALLLASLARTRGSRDLLAPLREGPEPA
jgi:hypothetical protein